MASRKYELGAKYVYVAEINEPDLQDGVSAAFWPRIILDYAIYETRADAERGLKYFKRKWAHSLHRAEACVRKMKVRGTGITHLKR